MSNSIGGLTLQLVAEESLRTLVPELVPLTEIAVTDFGSYVAERGSTVHTRYAGSFTSSKYNPANGYVPTNADSTDVAITLEEPDYVDVAFTDFEASTLSLERLRRLFMAARVVPQDAGAQHLVGVVQKGRPMHLARQADGADLGQAMRR